MTGTNVTAGVDSATADGLFGDLSADNPTEKFIAVKLAGILPTSGTFTVKQTNPALEYFSDDPSISQVGADWVKEKTYTADPAETDFWIVLTESTSQATVEVTPDGGQVTTYTVKSNWTAAT